MHMGKLARYVPPTPLRERTFHAGNADLVDQKQVDSIVGAPGFQ
jgi:hypothetical protein